MKNTYPQDPQWPEHVTPRPLDLESQNPEEQQRVQDAIFTEINSAIFPVQNYLDTKLSEFETINEDGSYGIETLSNVNVIKIEALGRRVVKIADVIRKDSYQKDPNNVLIPARVVADFGKPKQLKTIHDPELAHLTALTIAGNIQGLNNYNKRSKIRKIMRPDQWLAAKRNVIGAMLGEKAAYMAYVDDPNVEYQSVHDVIESRKSSFKGQRYIKGVKS